VISETLFSMDGDVADVVALAALAKRHDAALILDEAHAIGVWGPEGRGIAAEHGVVPDVLVGTCGKALGGAGAFAATSRAVADLLWNRARSLVFSTGIPPAVAASVQAALEIVRSSEGDDRRSAVVRNARELRRHVPGLGGDPRSAIAPLLVGDDREVMRRSARLFEARLFVQGIRPPTVPEGTARLRVSVSSGHSEADLATLADALRQ
jgi:7-keto-8-aminopelargonate synthetase-like enzyme